MGIINKLVGFVGIYALGKVLFQEKYEEIRISLWKNLKLLKPYFLQILDVYQFNTFGVDNVVVNHQKNYVDEQIKLLKNAIKKIDFDRLGKTIIKTVKEK